MTYLYLAAKFWREVLIATLFVLFCVATALYIERGHRIYEIKADAAAERARADAKAREVERRNYQGVIDAINKAEQQTAINERYASDARRANDSLRDTIGQLREQVASVSADARIEYTNSLTDVLAECSAEYLKMARQADGHARDSQMMVDAWPK